LLTKYILQIGLETDLDLFPLEDKLTDMFLAEIMEGVFKNHIVVKQIQYDAIEDRGTELVGISNHSGGSFHISDETEPFHKDLTE
jgi:hypothetical protein